MALITVRCLQGQRSIPAPASTALLLAAIQCRHLLRSTDRHVLRCSWLLAKASACPFVLYLSGGRTCLWPIIVDDGEQRTVEYTDLSKIPPKQCMRRCYSGSASGARCV